MHLTCSEMKDQYNALSRTMDCVSASLASAKKFYENARPRSLVFLGCGSSYCIAKSLALAAQMSLKIPAMAVAAGDFMLHAESYCAFLDDSLAVVISHSGSTSEVLAAVEHVKNATGSPVLSILCTGASKLAGMSDYAIEMPWAFDQGVYPTRSTSAMYLAGMQLLYGLAGCEKQIDGFERAVLGGPEYMEWFEGDLKFIASKPWTHAVLLGDAELAGVAQAGALAFERICRKPGAAFHLLDFRHGAMALTNRNMLVIAALADGNQYELALLADVAKTGVQLVVYSDIPLDGLPDAAKNISFGRSLPHAARGLPFLLISQAIACGRAELDGINPDEAEPVAFIKL